MSSKHRLECLRKNRKRNRRTTHCADPAVSLPPSPQPTTSYHEHAAQASISGKELAAQSLPSRRDPATKKLYDITEPFSDPVKERRRINAITAKENRDRKKKETDRMCQQIKCLTLVNKQCTVALKRHEAEIQKLDAKLKASQRRNEHLQKSIEQKEKDLRDHREKFLLFHSHLELIASIIDENNPAKKLIAGLLKSQLMPYSLSS
ncbi:uncharacterized protein LOC119595487 isoform X2 [Penaeus monodon]|uniref:uncharacterized protein LOC119595487 isoform X2 n=1 Tax=Penaeus monodon TaxID=6687 RepID=UPI0018A7627C|nr:uncharacterized protein LOC119595487 isoform X2 [Penaeus monodon]